MNPELLSLAAYILHNTRAGEALLALSAEDLNQPIENMAGGIGIGLIMVLSGIGLFVRMYNLTAKEFLKMKETDIEAPVVEEKKQYILYQRTGDAKHLPVSSGQPHVGGESDGYMPRPQPGVTNRKDSK